MLCSQHFGEETFESVGLSPAVPARAAASGASRCPQRKLTFPADPTESGTRPPVGPRQLARAAVGRPKRVARLFILSDNCEPDHMAPFHMTACHTGQTAGILNTWQGGSSQGRQHRKLLNTPGARSAGGRCRGAGDGVAALRSAARDYRSAGRRDHLSVISRSLIWRKAVFVH